MFLLGSLIFSVFIFILIPCGYRVPSIQISLKRFSFLVFSYSYVIKDIAEVKNAPNSVWTVLYRFYGQHRSKQSYFVYFF